MAGKGDQYRKVNRKKWSRNYDLIFRKEHNGKNDSIDRSDKRRTNSRKDS